MTQYFAINKNIHTVQNTVGAFNMHELNQFTFANHELIVILGSNASGEVNYFSGLPSIMFVFPYSVNLCA